MANDHVYGKRNIIKIYIKRYIYLLFRIIKRAAGRRKNNHNLVFYKVTSAQEYADFFAKINWFIPDSTKLDRVSLILEDNYTSIAPSGFLESGERQSPSNLLLVLESKVNLSSIMDDASVIAITNFRFLFNFSILKNIGKVEIIDPLFYSYVESITWQDLYFNSISNEVKEEYKRVSLERFKKFASSLGRKKSAICFVTGPSFDSYKNYDFSEFDFKLICNSIVKNEDFLQHIGGADVLVFADPVFHFGASKYAASFRSRVIDVVNKYNCYVFVPIKALPLVIDMDSKLSRFFIGIEYKKGDFNFPSVENFHVKDNGNILTNLLIPLASSFAPNISIFGADGRDKSEKYFWTHSKTAQFNDLMDSTFLTHPSFFRDRIYTDYYDEHCKTMSGIVEYGEARGKTYFSITKSYIPALREREINHK